MVLKGFSWVNNIKIRLNGPERIEGGHTMIKSGQIVLNGVNWVCNAKIWSNGVERSQLGPQYKNKSYGLEKSHLSTQW